MFLSVGRIIFKLSTPQSPPQDYDAGQELFSAIHRLDLLSEAVKNPKCNVLTGMSQKQCNLKIQDNLLP